jgi:subfamily B ATP-binding cassette protein MsbA
VRAGEVLALVGPSGAGKSTLVNLIPRFFDVTSGRILIDGHDLRDLTLGSLRRQVAQVTQETILFNDTVRNNIAYGQPDVKTPWWSRLRATRWPTTSFCACRRATTR